MAKREEQLERLQRRSVVGWFNEDVDGLDDEKIQTIFDEIREKVDTLIEDGREAELIPQRTSEAIKRVRMRRLVRVLGGESIRSIAKSEEVLPVAVRDVVRYSMARLALIEARQLEMGVTA